MTSKKGSVKLSLFQDQPCEGPRSERRDLAMEWPEAPLNIALPCCRPCHAMRSVSGHEELSPRVRRARWRAPRSLLTTAIPRACSSTRRSFPGPNDPPDRRPASAPTLGGGGQPDGNSALDDYCASIAGRTFHSLAEVKRAHAKCDNSAAGAVIEGTTRRRRCQRARTKPRASGSKVSAV